MTPAQRLHDLRTLRSKVDAEIARLERSMDWRDELTKQVAVRSGGLDPAAIRSPSRRPELVAARRIVAMLLYRHGQSTPAIGAYLGGRDHSTILHALNTITADELAMVEQIQRKESA